ncbi:MAG: hypothetical protein QM765_07725 [Myxococcales bacterium]
MNAVLAALRERSIRAWPREGQLHLMAPDGEVGDALRDAILAVKADLLAHLEAQVAWRADAMAAQARSVMSGFWPLLVAKPTATREGECLSCGEMLLPAEKSRCCLCVEAASRVVAASK